MYTVLQPFRRKKSLHRQRPKLDCIYNLSLVGIFQVIVRDGEACEIQMD